MQGAFFIQFYPHGTEQNNADLRTGTDLNKKEAGRKGQYARMAQNHTRRQLHRGHRQEGINGNRQKLRQPFESKVLIDDVYSGGKPEDGDYMLLSQAMKLGLFHPRCRHGLGTFYPELEEINHYDNEDNRVAEYGGSKINAAHVANMVQKYKRLVSGSVDPENIARYQDRLDYWESKEKVFTNQQNGGNLKGGNLPDSFRRTTDTLSDDEELKLVNPNYGQAGYNDNCANCTLAYEARKRGLDAQALPSDDSMSMGRYESMFDGACFGYFNYEPTAKVAVNILNKEIRSWGNGARGTIFIKWDGKNYGHYFSCKNVNGKAVYFDPQNATVNVDFYFDLADTKHTAILRTDNLDFSDNILGAITERTSK